MSSLQERYNTQGASNCMKRSRLHARAPDGAPPFPPDERCLGTQAVGKPNMMPRDPLPPEPPPGGREPAGRALTEQEKRLVRLLAMGRTDKEISRHLGIAENTVGWHLRILYRDFSVCCRTTLVVRCLEGGLLAEAARGPAPGDPGVRPDLHERVVVYTKEICHDAAS
jgi:hypothetical protein